jgi:hypothetical protein
MRLVILSCAALLSLSGCGDECREYSKFTCKQLERAEYTVVFFFPREDKPYYLGTAAGLSACGSVAYGYAASKNLSDNRDWSYVCCLHAEGSDCYEKHR